MEATQNNCLKEKNTQRAINEQWSIVNLSMMLLEKDFNKTIARSTLVIALGTLTCMQVCFVITIMTTFMRLSSLHCYHGKIMHQSESTTRLLWTNGDKKLHYIFIDYICLLGPVRQRSILVISKFQEFIAVCWRPWWPTLYIENINQQKFLPCKKHLKNSISGYIINFCTEWWQKIWWRKDKACVFIVWTRTCSEKIVWFLLPGICE